MTLTSSKMVSLGTKMPVFELFETKNHKWRLSDDFLGEKGTLIVFICNHCPYVVHIAPKLSEIIKEYKKKGIKTILISSNDAKAYPQDGPKNMKTFAETFKFKAPYFYDETQTTAKAFNAVCTPDFFLFNQNQELFYRGQMCDSRPGKTGAEIPTGKDIKNALESLLTQKPSPEIQNPSQGCNIKWKN